MLIARAAARACELRCGNSTVYARRDFLGAAINSGVPLPQDIEESLAELAARFQVISAEEEAALFVRGSLTERTVVVITTGAVSNLGDGIVGVEISTNTSHDGFRSETHQFIWTGRAWRLTSSDETGVVVVTAVS